MISTDYQQFIILSSTKFQAGIEKVSRNFSEKRLKLFRFSSKTNGFSSSFTLIKYYEQPEYGGDFNAHFGVVHELLKKDSFLLRFYL